jgi:hypothetical protein
VFDAQLLFPGTVPATGIKVYSPWFPRQADSIRVTLEVVQINGATIVVELFTKKSEDSGDGTIADSAGAPTKITANAIGRTTTEWLAAGTITLSEMIRYRFNVTGASVSDWVLFRMLSPVWFNSVKA